MINNQAKIKKMKIKIKKKLLKLKIKKMFIILNKN